MSIGSRLYAFFLQGFLQCLVETTVRSLSLSPKCSFRSSILSLSLSVSLFGVSPFLIPISMIVGSLCLVLSFMSSLIEVCVRLIISSCLSFVCDVSTIAVFVFVSR